MSTDIIVDGQMSQGPVSEDYQPQQSLNKDIKLGLVVCGILVLGLGGLAAIVPMTGAVIGPGKVTVASSVKAIGHPTGGIVTQIMVKDGDHVRQGQPLIRLDATVTGAAATYTGENVDQLLARAARLTAERDGAQTVTFPDELSSRVGDPNIRTLMAQERKAFALRAEARKSMVAQLRERISQSQADVSSSITRAQSYADQAALMNDELAATRRLYERRYTTLDRVNALQRSASGLSADAQSARDAAVSGRARIGELRQQMQSVEAEARSSAAAELMEVISRISTLRREEVAANDSFDRSVIRAPQAGVIDKLSYKTIGGIVPAGQTLLELVPDQDRFIVEATISPADIDQVHLDQEAVVRFSAFSSRTTPELTGRVTHVAADRTDDPTARTAFYRVNIELNNGEIRRLGSLKLRPGMPAEAFIQTGTRTMLNYILKPLTDQLARAFREN